MNLAILNTADATLHLFQTRGRNAEAEVEKYCLEHGSVNQFGHADWAVFRKVHANGLFASALRPILRQPARVIIDVHGGVATVRSATVGVEVRIVDHDQP